MTVARTTFRAVVLALTVFGGMANAGDGGRETPFSLGAGARALAMGGSLVALSDNATAGYYNPAGLAALEHQEVFFSHTVLFEHSAYDVASWVYPIDDRHGIGLTFMRLGTGDITRRFEYADLGTFSFSHSQLMMSYGHGLGESARLGTTLKVVNMALDDKSDFSLGLDLGFQAGLYRSLRMGVIARDVLPAELVLDSTGEEMPPSIAGGLFLQDVRLSPQAALTLGCDLEKFEDKACKVHAGAELALYGDYYLRGGWDRDNLALGGGLRHGRLAIDYAYKLVDYVGDLHHFSVSLRLGKSLTERKRLRELALRPPEPTEEEKLFTATMNRANSFLHRVQLDSAAAAFQDALALRPNDEEIIGSLAAIAEARRFQFDQEQRLRQAQDELNQTLSSFLNQAEIMFARKSYSAALDLLELIFDTDAQNARALSLRRQIEESRSQEIGERMAAGATAERQSKLSAAIEAYSRVLELDPGHQAARDAKQRVLATMDLPERLRLGIELYEKGHFEDARSRFEAILQMNPTEPVAIDYLNRIKDAQRRISTLEDLQKDKDMWALYLEGLRHMRNKEYQKAIDVWSRVLEAYPNNPNTLNNIEQARLRLRTEQSGN
jgi:tetratricopeptide (TPR) repeat protein